MYSNFRKGEIYTGGSTTPSPPQVPEAEVQRYLNENREEIQEKWSYFAQNSSNALVRKMTETKARDLERLAAQNKYRTEPGEIMNETLGDDQLESINRNELVQHDPGEAARPNRPRFRSVAPPHPMKRRSQK